MSEQKKCRTCKEDVIEGAKKCKHCGADLRNWFIRHPVITLVIAIPIIVGIFASSDDGANNASQPSGSNQNSNNVVPTKSVTFNDADKKALNDFYKNFVVAPKQSDEAYATWADNMTKGKVSVTQAYLDADNVIALNNEAVANINRLEIVSDNLSVRDKANIQKAKDDLALAYQQKNEALNQGKDYLNTNNLESLSKSKDQMSLFNTSMMSALASIMTVFTDHNLEIPKN